MSQVIYEASILGMRIRVYEDRVEYTPGFLSSPQSIPIHQIASIRQATLMNKLVIETTGGREYTIVTSKKREVEAAIYHAQAMQRSSAPPGELAALPPARFVPPAPTSRARVKQVLMIIGGCFIGLVVLGMIVGPSEKNSSRSSCDGSEGQREAWLETKSPDLNGFTPAAYGYRIAGRCNATLESTFVNCARSEVREIISGNPIVKQAVAMGFTTFACRSATERVEYPIGELQ